MQNTGESANVSGYYTGMFIIGFLMLFIAVANLALGIANAIICGLLGSIGYGIWGSVLVGYVVDSISLMQNAMQRTSLCFFIVNIFVIADPIRCCGLTSGETLYYLRATSEGFPTVLWPIYYGGERATSREEKSEGEEETW